MSRPPLSGDEAVRDASMAILLLDLQLEDEVAGYAYIALPTAQIETFLTAFAGKAMDWPEYVKLLYRGEGERPPEEIRAWFYDTYGFES